MSLPLWPSRKLCRGCASGQKLGLNRCELHVGPRASLPLPVPAPAATDTAGVSVHSPIEPLDLEVVVFVPDRLARMHEDRSVQYEVVPAIDQCEAVGLLAQRCPSS